jgi:hypothetical protein
MKANMKETLMKKLTKKEIKLATERIFEMLTSTTQLAGLSIEGLQQDKNVQKLSYYQIKAILEQDKHIESKCGEHKILWRFKRRYLKPLKEVPAPPEVKTEKVEVPPVIGD